MDSSEPPRGRTKKESIRALMPGADTPSLINQISDFVTKVGEITEAWQREDWLDHEHDHDYLFNSVRLVGQVWFRGHANSSVSLRPGLYREGTYKHLAKRDGSPAPTDNLDGERFEELFNLEHDMRIDFTSYGHLLNEANQANSAMDWYFTMQHHGAPTRLLDWTTNALAALFFAVYGLRQDLEDVSRLTPGKVNVLANPIVSVWMIDAYWLANHLSSTWYAPLLPWSEDAAKYLPSLETMIDQLGEAIALLPWHAMPIEPPAVHPRVAAQEGRFIIFGRTQDLLDEKIRLEEIQGAVEQLRVKQIRFEVIDPEATLRSLAQLGVSSRTLFPDFGGLADFVRWKHFHKVRAYERA